MTEQPDYRQLYNSMLGALDAIKLNYLVVEVAHDKKGKAIDIIYRMVSPTTEQLIGKSKEELIGKSRRELFGDIFDEFPIKFDSVLKTGKPAHFQIHGAILNRYYDVYAGKLTQNQVVALLEDITERKKAETALKESEEKFAKAFHSNSAAMTISRVNDGEFLDVNESFERLSGYSHAETMGHSANELGIWLNKEARDAEVKRLLKKGRLPQHEVIFGTKSGAHIDVILSAELITVGEQKCILSTVMDITERKKAEQALKTSSDRLYTTLSGMYGAILLVSENDQVEFANQAFCDYFAFSESPSELTGWPAEKILQKVLKAYQHPAAELKHIREIVNTGKPVAGEEIALKGNRTCLRDFIPLQHNGKSLSRLWYHVDITERKKAEEAIEQSEKNLEKLNRMLVAISNSNQALMQATDEDSFLQKSCKILVDDCGYKMVWIGYAENNKEKTVRPVAYAGLDKRYLDSLNITWANTARGRGPTGRAIRTGQPQFCNDMRTDPTFKPWRKNALKLGYASSIVLPLKASGETFGSITMYATESNAYSEEEITLLNELASDVAYGITMLRLRKEKERSEQERKIIMDFLLLVNQAAGTKELVGLSLDFIKQKSECEAVGIRLKEGDDYPYFEAKGFQSKHIELDNRLCSYESNGNVVRDSVGNPVLECMCGNVICGRFDLSKDFFTEKGSFWTNNTTQLLANTTDADRQVRTRNRCNGEGYESVALIPLSVGSTRLGLIQLNDKRKGMFTLDVIHMWERVADNLALALSKTMAEELARGHADELEKLRVKLEEKAAQVEEYATNMENLAEERARQLKDSERLAAIGATAGMVGHDIRNPLQSITGDLYLVKMELVDLPDSEQKSSLYNLTREIEQSIDYINKIVQDLQDYARPLKPVLQKVDLESLCREVVFKNGVPENIQASCQIDEQAKKLWIDSVLLKRILTNLVNNAIQAMPKGGKLTVEVSKIEKEVVLAVSDTGIGIPEEAKSKLFTPLMTTKSKGQGFGLAVVKRMTEALGGTVTFESQKGKGTKFIVRFSPTTKN